MLSVYLASRNTHKLAEFLLLLRPHGVLPRGVPFEFGEAPESGVTFQENAIEKARFYGDQVDDWVIADDSGLCVDALGGAPGVWSARYAGVHGDDMANNQKLLQALQHIPPSQRTAKFVCALAMWRRGHADPVVVIGEISGFILTSIRGQSGFGYDPLFYIPSLDKTFAELSTYEKNKISHRAQAVQRLVEVWEG